MKKNFINIVRLTTRIYPDPNAGGPAKHAFFISKFTASKKIKMINISTRPLREVKPSLKNISKNYKILYLPIMGLKIKETSPFKVLKFFMMYIIFSIFGLYKIHRKDKIDIIHAHSPSVTAIPALIFSCVFRIPIIYTYHGVDFKSKIEAYIYKIVNRKSSKIILISKKINKFFDYQKINYPNKIIVMPNGIECPDERNHVNSVKEYDGIIKDLKMENLNINDRIITYVGRMVFEQKVRGMVDFLEGFENFIHEFDSEEKNNIKLIFIGDGPFKKILDEAYYKCNIKNQVILAGMKERHEIPKYFAISVLSGLTSYVEGFPNVLLESMISGVPSIVSDVGEMKEVISDTGFVVKAGNIQEIKEALIQFFSKPKMQPILSQKSFNRVKENYDWKNIGVKMRDIYISIYISNNK